MFFYFLITIFSLLPNHRPAISGVDVIVNDVNNPYSQEQIRSIANIVVLKDELDITYLLELISNEYLGNETNVGIYYQTYQVSEQILEGDVLVTRDYQYVLTIYNIDFNNNRLNITVNTNVGNYLSISEIIKKVSDEFNLKVFNYEVIKNEYLEESEEGEYLIELVITNLNNAKYHVEVLIKVEKEKGFEIPLKKVSLYSLGSVTIILSIFLIIRRFKKK